jgi:Tfp pilus assembly protein PilV
MAVADSDTFPGIPNPRFSRGISVLDLLITALVLVVVLLAAVAQFRVYEKPAPQSAQQEQPAPTQPSSVSSSAPSQ